MALKRFFFEKIPQLGKRISLDSKEVQHLHAARVKTGDLIELFDKSGSFRKGNATIVRSIYLSLLKNYTK
jgi:16S rRNA U1498 N3-methylase RsmE